MERQANCHALLCTSRLKDRQFYIVFTLTIKMGGFSALPQPSLFSLSLYGVFFLFFWRAISLLYKHPTPLTPNLLSPPQCIKNCRSWQPGLVVAPRGCVPRQIKRTTLCVCGGVYDLWFGLRWKAAITRRTFLSQKEPVWPCEPWGLHRRTKNFRGWGTTKLKGKYSFKTWTFANLAVP